MIHEFTLKYDNVKLRPLMKDDIESLRLWRNDSSNNIFLSKIGIISQEQQEKWFEGYLNDNSEVIFAIVEIEELNRLIGSVSLYRIHDSQAEVGRILIGDVAAHGKGIGRKALVMAMTAGFEYLKLKKIVGSVSPSNVQAYSNDMRVGFRVVGRHSLPNGIVEDEIEISYEELKNVNNYVKDIELIG